MEVSCSNRITVRGNPQRLSMYMRLGKFKTVLDVVLVRKIPNVLRGIEPATIFMDEQSRQMFHMKSPSQNTT